jgi:putative membrane protein
MRTGWFVSALMILAVAWAGPLPALARHSFAAHMTMHMAVVAVAAPMLALAMAGTSVDPVHRMPRFPSPVAASMVEFATVWAWHAPAWHDAARHQLPIFMLEQTSFVLAGVLLWIAAIGGDRNERRMRVGGGVVALLFTSMHMTLLGALFALGNRPLFRHASTTDLQVADQQLGGVIMLLGGGAAYLAGGVWLTATALRPTSAAAVCRDERAP